MIFKVLPATVLLTTLVTVAPASAATHAPNLFLRKAATSSPPALLRSATNPGAGRLHIGPAATPTIPWGMPIWLEQKVTASDGVAGSAYGASVAMDGPAAIVGAPAGGDGGGVDHAPGAAYIMTYEGDSWNETQILLPSDGAADDEFGYAVTMRGNVAVVGALYAAPGGNDSQGEAYIFTRSNGVWSQSAALVANDGGAGDLFGASVATDGSRVLVGAPGATINGASGVGAVYVFETDGQSWTQTQKLTADDGVELDQLGVALAVRSSDQGTIVLAGAPVATINGNDVQGAVYVFDIEGGNWQQIQKIVAADGQAYDGFGYAIAYDGVDAVLTSPFAAVGDRGAQGAAYIFDGNAGQFVQTQKLIPNDPPVNIDAILFGYSVSLDHDFLYLGAPYVNSGVGEVYQFQNAGGDGWTLLQKVTASDALPGQPSGFGISCGASNGNFLVSQPGSTINSNDGQGAAYFYTQPLSDRIFTDGFEAQ